MAGTSESITSNAFYETVGLKTYQYIGDSSAKTFATFSNLKLTVSPSQSDNGKYTFYFYATTSSVKYLQQINVVVYGGRATSVMTYLSA